MENDKRSSSNDLQDHPRSLEMARIDRQYDMGVVLLVVCNNRITRWSCLRPKCDRCQVRLLGPNCSSADRKFRLVPVTDADDDVTKFTVTTSGRVCVSAPLDYESQTQHDFYVVVDDEVPTAGNLHWIY